MKFTINDLKDILDKKISKKTFMLYKIDKASFEILSKLIVKNGGKIKSILTNNIDFVISGVNYDSNIENALKKKVTVMLLYF
jgi:NAD-dependent DNA ligase